MLNRLTPLIGRIAHRSSALQTLERVASRSWVISPTRQTMEPSARFDDSDLAKLPPDADDVEVVRGGLTTHHATRVHELHDVVISNGHLFTRSFQFRMGSMPPPLIAKQPTRRYRSALLCTSTYSATVFGHWVFDGLPLVLLAHELGEVPVTSATHLSRSQREWLALLDLDHDHLFDARFERLLVVDDIGHTGSKLARYQALRARGQARRDPRRGAAVGVFVRRGRSGQQRVLVNEDELVTIAVRRGLAVIDIDNSPPARDILDLCFDAPLIVGSEGSHLVNAFPWMHPRGTMFALMPPWRFMLILKGMCDALGAGFSFVVGEARDGHAFHVDPAAFERRLDEHLGSLLRA